MHDLIFDEDDDEATLAEHLKFDHSMDTVELFNLSFLFTILQLSPFNLDESEQKWVSRLTCMKPFGLNKEVPRGVTDSVHTMFRKSLGRSTQRKVKIFFTQSLLPVLENDIISSFGCLGYH